MRSRQQFLLSLTAFVLVYFCYGLKRFTLGIDFTDEGAHISWPLRMLFGEKLFASEPATLLRPLVGYVSILFKLYPTITLYEFRMLGWSIHLFAFVILSILLFRLSDAPLQSPLIASVPLFVCNIFSLASPSYYTLSSDFLLVALSLRGHAAIETSKWNTLLNIASGLALFIATMAYTALGIVAAIVLVREMMRHKLAQNLLRCKLTPSNAGVLVFVACWLAFLLNVIISGGHIDWIQRVTLFSALTSNPLHSEPIVLIARLATYPFSYSGIGMGFSMAALVAAGALHLFSRARRFDQSRSAAAMLAFLLIVLLITTFSYEPRFLTICFVTACAFLMLTSCLRVVDSQLSIDPEIRFLIAMSSAAAVLCAITSFYFSLHRSWISGILGLPFAFAVGLTLLLNSAPRHRVPYRILLTASLAIAVLCVGWDHYGYIQRDAIPACLRSTFRIPKLQHIRSTDERVQALDNLYEHLHPKLARGELLLAFDDCPMFYYLFDAKPAYSQTWATRYAQKPELLQELDREFYAKPLPRYAIRTMVDLSYPVWRRAPQRNYDNYPLNETVLANYDLERTIFPFEVWRLKAVEP